MDESLSSRPKEDLSRDGDPFPGRFDSAEPRVCCFVADICPMILFSELPTKLADMSDVKGVCPVTAFNGPSLLFYCTLADVSEVMGFSLSAVPGGLFSLFLLMPIRVAAIPFFLSKVLFAEAIAAFNFNRFDSFAYKQLCRSKPNSGEDQAFAVADGGKNHPGSRHGSRKPGESQGGRGNAGSGGRGSSGGGASSGSSSAATAKPGRKASWVGKIDQYYVGDCPK